jgi:hypothetical protein
MLGPRSAGVGPWVYPYDRYYYGWYDELRGEQPSDHDIKSTVVDRLCENPTPATTTSRWTSSRAW